MNNMQKAERILKALENSCIPISWHCIREPDIIKVIIKELNLIDKEEVECE